MNNPKIYISYSHSDADPQWVRSFVESLKSNHISVWFDQNEILPGDNIENALENGLRGCDIFVFLIPRKDSKFIFFELGVAIAGGKRIIGIVPENLDPSMIPAPFRVRKYLIQKSPEETALEVAKVAQQTTQNLGNNENKIKEA